MIFYVRLQGHIIANQNVPFFLVHSIKKYLGEIHSKSSRIASIYVGFGIKSLTSICLSHACKAEQNVVRISDSRFIMLK